MKKSIHSVFLAFVVLTILLSGCAPASTPVPATLTSIPTNTSTPTSIPPTSVPPTDTPLPTPTQVPWNLVTSIATKEKPIETQNTSDQWWQNYKLSGNLKFSSAFEMKLNMESTGTNGINLTYTLNKGEPWWKDDKRIELECAEGTLGIALRDGSKEEVAFSSSANYFMPKKDGVTVCQITVRFDQYAKNIQIFQDNKIIFEVSPEQVGNFQGGLFPDGNILKVELTTSPKSGSKISSVKLVELGFYVPPE